MTDQQGMNGAVPTPDGGEHAAAAASRPEDDIEHGAAEASATEAHTGADDTPGFVAPAPRTVVSVTAPDSAAGPLAPRAWGPDSDATIVEPVPAPVDQPPLMPVTRASRMSGRVRWGVALIVVALVVGASAVAFAVLSGGNASLSTLAGWAPADSYVYGEVRLDLPGDQHQAVADLLSHFPGFADESSLDQKVSETLDRLIGDASSGSTSYADIKPWLGDAIAVSAHGSLDSASRNVPVLVAVSIKNAAQARDWVAKHDSGLANQTTQSYNGTSLTLSTLPGGQTTAFAILDSVILGGDEASVKQAIDSKGSSGFEAEANVKSAVATIDGTPLATVYVDVRRYFDVAMAAVPGAGSMLGTNLTDRIPAWAMMTARARGDGLQFDVVTPTVSGAAAGQPHASTLAAHLPSTTIAAIEVHDIGKGLRAALDQLKQQDATKGAVDQIDQALTALGGFDSVIGWAGDADIVVTAHDGGLDGGLVVATSNPQAASAVTAMLRNFLALAGQGSSLNIAVSDEPYGEGTITVVDLGDVTDLAGLTGQSVPIPSGTHAGFAYSIQKGLFVVGSTDAFVKSVIDTASGSSLADQDRYKQAIERAGASNTGQGYLDMAGIATAVEAGLPADSRSKYESDVKPYVTPLGAIAWANSGGNPARMRAVVTIR